MNIDKFSEEALTDALIKELCSGRQFLDSLQKYRERDAAQVAKAYRDRGTRRGDTLRHLAEIPQREYMQMVQKYGVECWNDRQFVKDFQRLEPTMASNKL
jgi:hypothetical protein